MELASVSVIVPTYQRAAVLPYLLGALARQLYPADRIEVLIVDNSSTDGTAGVVEAWQGRLGFPLRYYRKENRGPAASRNYAAARSQAEILAFTDSDCVPDPRWLRAGVQAVMAGAALVSGPVVPLRRTDEPGVLAARLAPYREDRGLYPTANLFVRRAAFDAVAGFDESFGALPWGDLVGGEDTDFAWRLKRSGAPACFSGAAIVGHLSSPVTARQWLLRPFRLQVLPRLVRHVPQLRQSHLWLRYFNSREHAWFQLFWLSLLAACLIRSPRPLVGTVPYLAVTRRVALDRLQARKPGRALAALALTALGHALETAVLAGASLRYRRVVL